MTVESVNEIGNEKPKQYRNLMPPWQKGQITNPNGRPKGSRNKLNEDFLSDLHESWKAHGKAAIIKMIEEKPADYVRCVASILPRQVEVKDGAFDDASDDDIAAAFALVRSALALGQSARERAEITIIAEPAQELPALP